jgi:hypothetical protein
VTRKLGPKVPADPERAERNREAVRQLVMRHDPVLVRAVAAERVARLRAARSR